MNKKTKKQVKIKEINWHRVISLSAAGQYIQNQLNEELNKLKSSSRKKNK